MTGYGKGTAEIDKRTLTVEMKSVNNRFLEINCRMPKIFAACEDGLKKLIGQKLKRGAVDVFINYEDKSVKSFALCVDMNAAAEYARQAKAMSAQLKIKNNADAAFIMRQEGVLKQEQNIADADALLQLMTAAGSAATEALDKMRAAEGETLKAELTGQGKTLEELVKKIDALSETAAEEYRTKVGQRMKEILGDVSVDEAKLLNEIAFLADRSDITEELARLKSHMKQYYRLLDEPEPGKKLDFLTQELNREANTIGSKVTNIKITALVMETKAVIEKIKEQARNVE